MWQRAFNNPRLAAVALVGVAIVWGGTFVLTAQAVETYPVFGFISFRFLIATIAFALIFSRQLIKSVRNFHRPSLNTAIAAGVFLTLGYIFQTIALIPAAQGGTSPARVAFITGLYVILVPIGQFIFRRQKPRLGVVIGIICAMAGLFFLSGITLRGGSTWAWGDSMVLICAFAYSGHMLILGNADESFDTILLTFVQLVVVMVLSGAVSLVIREPVYMPNTSELWFAFVICGVLGSAFAFAIQTWAQQVMVPAQVALILVSEPAFGGLFGWLIAGAVHAREAFGAAFMMAGMIASEMIGTKRLRTEASLEGPAVLIEHDVSERSLDGE